VERPCAALSEEVRALIEQELNVKRLDILSDASAFASLSAQPNFRTLGPRLGSAGPTVATWIKGQSAAWLREHLAQGPLSISVDGAALQVLPEDVLYAATLAPGLVEVAGGNERVLLDVRIDEDLRRQGVFREVAHRVQLARKEAGLDVTDRIVLSYEADPELAPLLVEHEADLAAEVLASEVRRSLDPGCEYRESMELPMGRLTIGLAKARAH
jgi:isoleucyl-tRNA synthetase